MKRVVKTRNERINEILDIAQTFFLKYGFERTTISNIVKESKIAQGTFYYYFKSKDELLNAIMKRNIDKITQKASVISCSNSMNAIKKIEIILNSFLNYDGWSNEMIAYIHHNKDSMIHHKVEMQIIENLVPIVKSILLQGINEGLFNVPYPQETAEFIVLGVGGMYDQFRQSDEEGKLTVNRINAIELLLKRILDIDESIIKLEFK